MATILFLFGEDTYRSTAKLMAIKQRYIDSSLGDTNLSVLDGQTVSHEELVRQVQAFPFLAKSRLVVIKNLLLAGQKDLLDRVYGYLEKIPESTVVLFYESGQPDQRLKLFKALNIAKRAERFDPLAPAELDTHIEKTAERLGIVIERPATRRLAQSVGNDLWRIETELTKLAAYIAGRGLPAVTVSVVDEMVETSVTTDVFQLIDALARQDGKRALEELQTLLNQGEAELYIFSMIVYQFRTLLVVTEAYTRGQTAAGAIAKSAKIAPFVAEKTLRLIRDWPLKELVGRYEQLLEYDRAMKLGELEPRLALELLIGEFTDKNLEARS